MLTDLAKVKLSKDSENDIVTSRKTLINLCKSCGYPLFKLNKLKSARFVFMNRHAFKSMVPTPRTTIKYVYFTKHVNLNFSRLHPMKIKSTSALELSWFVTQRDIFGGPPCIVKTLMSI